MLENLTCWYVYKMLVCGLVHNNEALWAEGKTEVLLAMPLPSKITVVAAEKCTLLERVDKKSKAGIVSGVVQQ